MVGLAEVAVEEAPVPEPPPPQYWEWLWDGSSEGELRVGDG